MKEIFPTIERKSEVLDRFKIGKTSLHNWINKGLFPTPISLGGDRAVGWFQHETTAVLLAMAAGKDKDEIKTLVSELLLKRKQCLGMYL